MNRPESVWTFFNYRVKGKKDGDDYYQAIPFELQELRQLLARDVDLAITELRKWYRAVDPMFRFTGGLMLQAVFPVFTDELARSFIQMIASGSDEDYDFTSHLLENYHCENPTHEVIKELIERLPEDDPRLTRLDICLSNTGVVSGEFGMVAAYRKKKEVVALWLEDSRPEVRAFASVFVRRMDQQITSEQRSTEMRRELRMRDFEVDIE
jgi:hypothetical protein